VVNPTQIYHGDCVINTDTHEELFSIKFRQIIDTFFEEVKREGSSDFLLRLGWARQRGIFSI